VQATATFMDSRATLAGGQQGFDVANEAMADTAERTA